MPSGIGNFFGLVGRLAIVDGTLSRIYLMWSVSSCCLASGFNYFRHKIVRLSYLRYRRQESYIEMYTIDTEVMLSVNLERLHYLAIEAKHSWHIAS